MQKFAARPRKHAGKELIVDVEVGDGLQGLGVDECTSLGLRLGDTIMRRVKCEALGNYPTLIAAGEMADWLEGCPKGAKAKVKLRLLFGQSSETHYDESNMPYETPVIHTGLNLIAVLDREQRPETVKAV